MSLTEINSDFGSAELSQREQQAATTQMLNQLAQQMLTFQHESREAIIQLRCNMAAQEHEMKNLIHANTRDVISSINARSKEILDFLVNDRIRQLEIENQSLKLAVQNNCLIGTLKR